MKSMKDRLFYLAHPVSPDDYHGFNDNKAHTLRVLRIIHDAGWEVICPWYTDLLYLDDQDPAHRERALLRDERVIRAIGGNVILSGHKISSGMQREMIAGMGVGGCILSVIGVPDDEIAARLEAIARPVALQGVSLG